MSYERDARDTEYHDSYRQRRCERELRETENQGDCAWHRSPQRQRPYSKPVPLSEKQILRDQSELNKLSKDDISRWRRRLDAEHSINVRRYK